MDSGRYYKRDTAEILVKGSIVVGGILGAATGVMMTSTLPGMVAAGTLGLLGGAVALPITGAAIFMLGAGIVELVKNRGGTPALVLAVLAAGIIDALLVRPIGSIAKKIGGLFSSRKNQQTPPAPERANSLKDQAAQGEFNAGAKPAAADTPGAPKAETPQPPQPK